jgi:hypothetical protein
MKDVITIILPCAHNLCTKCFARIMDESSIKCPLCRKNHLFLEDHEKHCVDSFVIPPGSLYGYTETVIGSNGHKYTIQVYHDPASNIPIPTVIKDVRIL